MIADFGALIHALADASVEFVIIGGAALVVHGSPRTTEDLDICYARSTDNLIRLSIALEPLHPYLRGVPPGLPFRLDARTLTAGLNFTLTSDKGDIDLLGEVTGLGAFETVAARALPTTLFERRVLVLALDAIETAKRAAGRIKDLGDLAIIAELKRRA